MAIADELLKLQQLRQSGAIDEDEFRRAKERIINGKSSTGMPFMDSFLTGDAESQTRQWGMLLHLSILAGYPLPIVGFVVPILIWQLKKTELPGLDEHGKNAVNWIISAMIYGVACGILYFVFIGMILLPVLVICTVVFSIIAGIKANNGEVWKYPGAIAFFK
jgi:uncharacterized Tic20 family protein